MLLFGMEETGRFMVAMGALITHPETQKVLMIKRSKDKDYSGGIWEYPMGRLNHFEEPLDGLIREINEEVGIGISPIKPLSIFHIYRGEKTADNELVGIIYWAEAMTFDIKLSEEHTEYKWVTPEEALEMVPKESMKSDIRALIKEMA